MLYPNTQMEYCWWFIIASALVLVIFLLYALNLGFIDYVYNDFNMIWIWCHSVYTNEEFGPISSTYYTAYVLYFVA